MEQYINKAALVEEIEDWRDKIKKGIFSIPLTGSDRAYATFEYEILGKVRDFLDTLEEPADEDLEEFAKRESELFGEREYEVDYLDRNALTKGFYWGCKTGARWQKQQDAPEIKDANIEKIWEKL